MFSLSYQWLVDIKQAKQIRQLDGHIHTMWLTRSQRGCGRVFVRGSAVRWVSLPLIPPLFPTHTKARLQPGPVQRPGLSELWHNTNLCPPQRESPSTVTPFSEKALFWVREMMITEMRQRWGGGDLSCYITSREESDLCRVLRPQTLLSLQHRGGAEKEGGRNNTVCYFSANWSSVWLKHFIRLQSSRGRKKKNRLLLDHELNLRGQSQGNTMFLYHDKTKWQTLN